MKPVKLPRWGRILWKPARFKGVHGGRGSGKSHTFATALLLQGVEQPLRILCARETQRAIRDSSKRLLDNKIDQLGLRGFYTSTDSEIRGANGTMFIFSGLFANIDSIKSMEGLDRVWVEEAQSVSQASIDTLIPTLRAAGSELWFTWNPDDPKDPVDALLRSEARLPGSMVIEVNHEDNPWFPDELRQQMEWDRARDPEKYQHVWRGAYRRMTEARVFHNWRVEAFEHGPEDGIYRFGADWGFSIDPTVLVRCFLDGRTLYVDHEAYAVGCPIDLTPALFAGTDERGRWPNPSNYPGVPGAHKWPIVADSARPETIDYMAARGFDITPAQKGAGSVEDGVEFLKSVDIVVHPRCSHVIDELSFYSWKTDPKTGAVVPILADRSNHTIDALRYALEGVRKAAGAAVHVAIPRARSAPGSMWGNTYSGAMM